MSNDSSRQLAAIVGPSSEEAVVVGGIETVGLIDSGSQVTPMSVSFYKSHFTSQPIRKLEEKFCIMGAGGQKVPYMGYISVPLTLPIQWAGTDKAAETMILICPDTPLSSWVPIIVGTNTFRLLSSQTKGVGKETTIRPEAAFIYQDSPARAGEGRLGHVEVRDEFAAIPLGETKTVLVTAKGVVAPTQTTVLVQESGGGRLKGSE